MVFRLKCLKEYVILYVVLRVHTLGKMAQWLSWLERRPVTAKVVGSSPIWVVSFNILFAVLDRQEFSYFMREYF